MWQLTSAKWAFPFLFNTEPVEQECSVGVESWLLDYWIAIGNKYECFLLDDAV